MLRDAWSCCCARLITQSQFPLSSCWLCPDWLLRTADVEDTACLAWPKGVAAWPGHDSWPSTARLPRMVGWVERCSSSTANRHSYPVGWKYVLDVPACRPVYQLHSR